MGNVLRGVILAGLAVGMAAGQIVLSPAPGGGGGGGAPTDATYWVGSANGSLSAEIVVNDIASLEAAIAAYDFNDAANLTTGTIPEARIGAFSSLVNINGGFEIADFRCTASAGAMTCQDPTGGSGDTSFIVKGGADQSLPLLSVQDSSGNPYLSITQSDNIRIGLNAGAALTAGRNIAIGDSALDDNVSGQANIAIGDNAMSSAGTTSSVWENVAVGGQALKTCASCSRNVAIGTSAGTYPDTGDNNVFVGHGAGATGYRISNSIYLGYNAGVNDLQSNILYIDNQDRGATATDDRTGALIYGVFSATVANQTLALNATVTVDKLAIEDNTTPTASTDACATETIWGDGTYLYYCIASGNIGRVAWATGW